MRFETCFAPAARSVAVRLIMLTMAEKGRNARAPGSRVTVLGARC